MVSPVQTSAPAPEKTLPSPEEAARKAEVTNQLKHLQAPTLGNDLVSLGMVRNLRVVGDYVYLRLYVGAHQLVLEHQVQQSLSELPWVKKVYVQVCTIPGVRTTLAIASGKGGVGKSTTAVQLAIALTRTGAKVGLLDADIYGPNVPQLLGLGQAQVEVVETPNGQRFVPLEVHGIKLMSVGLLAEPDHPLAWRGPVLHKILTQFIQQVAWGELDYLLVDLPPGTGDAQITLVQESPICGVIMVTTPHAIALADLRRSIHMFHQVGVPVLGLIENMSYLACPCCDTRTPIFGSGGGTQIAAELSVPLWGQVPIDPSLSTAGEKGLDSDSLLQGIFDPIAQGLNGTFGD
ncbi:MAG: Mrp/NBP35 family ATP-binding protein [Tildeniella torsiva UHER 1998/13D]|jgi:ATP-binding protein involved in chromosome partitioning|nr:Mrp/NBP35 family ATP-binding protein [Tildeniella torsiva UHER 1998/13D]